VNWAQYSSNSQSQSFGQAYTNQSGLKDDYRPKTGMIRESVASVANPKPTPIIIGLDCTGSMNDLALSAKKNIGTLMAETYDRNPVSDPQIMAMFFDDVLVSGSNALQITQFEADIIITDQMEQLYWVGNGGGNGSESYSLPLHFAINHTKCDSFDEGRKGFIFTMGDDGIPPALTDHDLKAIYGPDYPVTEPLSYQSLLTQAEENWHVFHLYPSRGRQVLGTDHIIKSWRNMLGEHFIVLEDIEKLAEVLVGIMSVIGGADAATVAASFSDPGTSLVVASAIKGLTTGSKGKVVRVPA
jgi:hypothetical protein